MPVPIFGQRNEIVWYDRNHLNLLQWVASLVTYQNPLGAFFKNPTAQTAPQPN